MTSLILAHTTKNPETKKRSIYGNTFFTAYSRSVWEIMGEQETGSNVLEIGLRHTKFNPIGQQKPLGYKLTFDREAGKTIVEYQDPRNMEEMLKHQSQRQQIMAALKNGAMEVAELAELLETGQATVKSTLYRMKSKGEAIALTPTRWGLAVRNNSD